MQNGVPEPRPPDVSYAAMQQSGIDVGAPSRQRIHGLSAVTAQFLARTPQSPLRGVAAFVRYDGRTYQMMSYSGQTSGDIVETCAPVRDLRILTVRPQRIDIVQAFTGGDAAGSRATFRRVRFRRNSSR